jgi:predicted permease
MAIYLQNYATGEERSGFFVTLLERLRAIPGAEAAGVTNNMPMTGNRSTTRITIDGYDSGQDGQRVDIHNISGRFFAAIGARIVAGRDFETSDDVNGPLVAIVNESFARQYLGNRDALGARFRFGGADADGRWYTVVGVANDIHQRGLGDAQGPSLYMSYRQAPAAFMNVVVRTSGDLGQMAEALQAAAWSIDPFLPLDRINTVEEQARTTIVTPRFYAWLLGGFATVAFLLAIAGIYGTVAYGVGMRVRALGIRVALGASAAGVVGLVVRQGMAVAAAGIAVGIPGALALSRVLSSLLYDISPVDVATYAASAAILLATAAVACYVPARRAARVDPVMVLRSE